jgi:hypothetical protein
MLQRACCSSCADSEPGQELYEQARSDAELDHTGRFQAAAPVGRRASLIPPRTIDQRRIAGLSPDAVRALQRTIGNRSVGRMTGADGVARQRLLRMVIDPPDRTSGAGRDVTELDPDHRDLLRIAVLQRKGDPNASPRRSGCHTPTREATAAIERQSAFRSAAVRLRSGPFLRAGKATLRRAPVSTWGGDWSMDQYDLRKDVAPDDEPAEGLRGLTVQLRFKPKRTIVDAKLIGLTQTAQSVTSGAARYQRLGYEKRSIPAASARNTGGRLGESDEGTHIDQSPGLNNPITAVTSTQSVSLADTNTPQGTSPSPDPGTHFTTSRGQLGWNYRDRPSHLTSQDATLIDVPQLTDAQKDSRQIFETTAVATKGAQAGTYYGSVRWGWRTDSAENFTKINLEKISDGGPSSTFLEAARLWNAEKSNIHLPILDLRVTAAPVTLKRAGRMNDINLPVGTRVEIVRNFVGPLQSGTVRVAGGPFTGAIGIVGEKDWPKLTNERP